LALAAVEAVTSPPLAPTSSLSVGEAKFVEDKTVSRKRLISVETLNGTVQLSGFADYAKVKRPLVMAMSIGSQRHVVVLSDQCLLGALGGIQ
jgi:hypothetical protein